MIDDKRLDEIEERANKATEGEWSTLNGYGIVKNEYPLPYVSNIGDALSSNDASFIAHARQDVPDLVAEVRRLRDALRHKVEEKCLNGFTTRCTECEKAKELLKRNSD